jgi:hypothetical protein
MTYRPRSRFRLSVWGVLIFAVPALLSEWFRDSETVRFMSEVQSRVADAVDKLDPIEIGRIYIATLTETGTTLYQHFAPQNAVGTYLVGITVTLYALVISFLSPFVYAVTLPTILEVIVNLGIMITSVGLVVCFVGWQISRTHGDAPRRIGLLPALLIVVIGLPGGMLPAWAIVVIVTKLSLGIVAYTIGRFIHLAELALAAGGAVFAIYWVAVFAMPYFLHQALGHGRQKADEHDIALPPERVAVRGDLIYGMSAGCGLLAGIALQIVLRYSTLEVTFDILNAPTATLWLLLLGSGFLIGAFISASFTNVALRNRLYLARVPLIAALTLALSAIGAMDTPPPAQSSGSYVATTLLATFADGIAALLGSYFIAGR